MFHPYLGGRAHQFWATGTVSWVWFAVTEHMLGIRRDFAGLRLQPCIPAEWSGYRAVRVFRGCRYEIEVENPNHLQTGDLDVYVDGQLWQERCLPFEKGGLYKVKAVMR